MINCLQNFSRKKPERKRALESPRPRLEDNFKVFLKVIICEDVDWNHRVRIGSSGEIS